MQCFEGPMDAITDTVALVLAAGKGTRMDGDMPKVLVHLDGKPLLAYILAALQKAGFSPEQIVAVVGYKYDEVLAFLGDAYPWALQKEQLGTGHAVLAARNALQAFDGTVMVLYGDVPLLTDDIIRGFRQAHAAGGAVCSVLTAELEEPAGYSGDCGRT
ncbi:NTP transferase domain-containing protein [Planctomycetota bacterium]